MNPGRATSKELKENRPIAEVGGLPHGSHQSVDSLGLSLAVNAHGLLHRHGNHLLKQV